MQLHCSHSSHKTVVMELCVLLMLGEMQSAWAVDNLFIGRMPMNPSSMQDDFNSDTWDDSWLFVNNGQIGQFCTQYTRYIW